VQFTADGIPVETHKIYRFQIGYIRIQYRL